MAVLEQAAWCTGHELTCELILSRTLRLTFYLVLVLVILKQKFCILSLFVGRSFPEPTDISRLISRSEING